LSDATEILHVEVSGPPYKPEKKHTVGDAKKLLMMAVCNLSSKQLDLLKKKKYLALELASCIIPFSFEAIMCYSKIFNFFAVIRNEFIEREKIQKKIRCFIPSVEDDTGDLREWINLPDEVTEDDMDELLLYDVQ
ncbi:16192_t:CDS:2, partial [Racocetra fulgida]